MPRRPVADPALAVCYVRASTDRQDLSPDAQLAAVKAWASSRGVQVVAVHQDLGVSGAAPVEKCPGLLAALDALRAHGAGLLAVARRDRLARDPIKAAIVEGLAKKVGARVASADGVAEGDDPAAELFRLMVDGFARFERALIAQRTSAALQARRARGLRAGGVPIGFTVDGERLVEHPGEQAAIALARRLRSRRVSLRKIGERLVAAGHLPRGGKRWRPSTIARMVG